jgi:hypothetical protein
MAYWSLLLLSLALGASAQELPQLKWSGDLRVREQLEKDHDNEARLSTRLRARFGVNVQIYPELRAEIRLASAKTNRSTNQSLGDSAEPGMRRRFVGLDLGYAEWKPAPFAKVYAGRFPQIAFRPGDTQIVLDDDLTLEGAAFSLDYEVYPAFKVFLHAGSTYIRENYDNYYSEDLADNNFNFGQLGAAWNWEKYRVTIGAGFYNFTGVQGKAFADLAAGGKPNGNHESSAGVVKNPYLPKQIFIDLKAPIGSFDSGAFFEYVQNQETSDPNQAFWTGFSLGQKNWDAQWGYLEVESDSTLALFTNSDFGNGVTDSRGWIAAVRWKFMKNVSVRLTEFVARTRMDVDDRNYQRTHLDFSASF